MPYSNGETVGDRIIRDRLDALKDAPPRERKRILSLPAPRSIRNQEWPPRG